jgi:hypothetical protein
MDLAVLHTTAASWLCLHWLLPHPLWLHVASDDSFPEQLTSLSHTRPEPSPDKPQQRAERAPLKPS